MTPDQAATLQVGDEVEYRVRGTVHRLNYERHHLTGVLVRRYEDPRGTRPLMLCATANVHRVKGPTKEAATEAVILADWLDDHDEPEAARKLRQAFGPTVGMPASMRVKDGVVRVLVDPVLMDQADALAKLDLGNRSVNDVDEVEEDALASDLQHGSY